MSYCVNCGVELEESITKCPLCQTPVINPRDLERLKEIQSPFPEQKGDVEEVSKTDIAIFISVSLIVITICCAIIDQISYPAVRWWLLVAGFCGIVWTLSVPPLISKKFKSQLYILINGLMVAVYLGLIGMFVDNYDWVIDIGLPITAISLILAECYAGVCSLSKSYILRISTFTGLSGLLCLGIDLILDKALNKPIRADWSAIVLTVCSVIIILLITILSRKNLRNYLHRIFHLK